MYVRTSCDMAIGEGEMTIDTVGVVTAAMGGTLLVGGLMWNAEWTTQQELLKADAVATPQAEAVSIDRAIKIARDNYRGQVIEAVLIPGVQRALWTIAILTDDQRTMTVQIDAESASVIGLEELSPGPGMQRVNKRSVLGSDPG